MFPCICLIISILVAYLYKYISLAREGTGCVRPSIQVQRDFEFDRTDDQLPNHEKLYLHPTIYSYRYGIYTNQTLLNLSTFYKKIFKTFRPVNKFIVKINPKFYLIINIIYLVKSKIIDFSINKNMEWRESIYYSIYFLYPIINNKCTSQLSKSHFLKKYS